MSDTPRTDAEEKGASYFTGVRQGAQEMNTSNDKHDEAPSILELAQDYRPFDHVAHPVSVPADLLRRLCDHILSVSSANGVRKDCCGAAIYKDPGGVEYPCGDCPHNALPSSTVPTGSLWSFLRRVLEHGAAIQQDYAAGNHKSYEEYAARLDAAARAREEELGALLSASGARKDG